MTRTIWTFPGQLAEYVGMTSVGLLDGSEIVERNLDLASAIVGVDLAKLCREGPEDLLHRDDCAAAAVIAVGAAAAEELQRAGVRPDGLLGYSLGFYTAATVSGAISLASALRIVATISREGERLFGGGGMAMGFVTGLKVETFEGAVGELLARGEIAITNVNSQAQIIFAGRTAALEETLERIRPQTIRCERLPISRPYHSSWMAPIARTIEELCGEIEIVPPRIPLYDHAAGAAIETAGAVRGRLSGQLTSRLDWRLSIGRLVAGGAGQFIEMPPGSATTRMIRWISRDVSALSMDVAADRERFVSGTGARRGGGA